MTVGAITEYLISIKDRNKHDLTFDEIAAINEACNILNHVFPRMEDSSRITDDSVAAYGVTKTEVMDWLHEAGFVGNEANAAYLIAQEMPETLALCMKHKSKEVVYDFIRLYRKELERL